MTKVMVRTLYDWDTKRPYMGGPPAVGYAVDVDGEERHRFTDLPTALDVADELRKQGDLGHGNKKLCG